MADAMCVLCDDVPCSCGFWNPFHDSFSTDPLSPRASPLDEELDETFGWWDHLISPSSALSVDALAADAARALQVEPRVPPAVSPGSLAGRALAALKSGSFGWTKRVGFSMQRIGLTAKKGGPIDLPMRLNRFTAGSTEGFPRISVPAYAEHLFNLDRRTTCPRALFQAALDDPLLGGYSRRESTNKSALVATRRKYLHVPLSSIFDDNASDAVARVLTSDERAADAYRLLAERFRRSGEIDLALACAQRAAGWLAEYERVVHVCIARFFGVTVSEEEEDGAITEPVPPALGYFNDIDRVFVALYRQRLRHGSCRPGERAFMEFRARQYYAAQQFHDKKNDPRIAGGDGLRGSCKDPTAVLNAAMEETRQETAPTRVTAEHIEWVDVVLSVRKSEAEQRAAYVKLAEWLEVFGCTADAELCHRASRELDTDVEVRCRLRLKQLYGTWQGIEDPLVIDEASVAQERKRRRIARPSETEELRWAVRAMARLSSHLLPNDTAEIVAYVRRLDLQRQLQSLAWCTANP